MAHILKVNYHTRPCEDCAGHSEPIATCTCGWHKSLYGVNYSGVSKDIVAEFEHLKHRLEVLEGR